MMKQSAHKKFSQESVCDDKICQSTKSVCDDKNCQSTKSANLCVMTRTVNLPSQPICV